MKYAERIVASTNFYHQEDNEASKITPNNFQLDTLQQVT